MPDSTLNRSMSALILRWGLAFVCLYGGFAELLYTRSGAPFIPSFLWRDGDVQGLNLIVVLAALYEIILAGWLFWGKRLRAAAAVTFLSILLFTLMNLGQLDFVFRDVGLALSALALYFLARDSREGEPAI